MNHGANELMAWWDDVRDWMAFGIAPLAAPLIMAASIGFDGAPQSMVVMIAVVSLMFSYFVTLLFGLPLYALLRAYGISNFWLAPAAGLAAGLATMHLGHSWLDLPLLPIAGLAGAAVGALLWLIARPDRPRRNA